MDQYFPISQRVRANDANSLVVAIVIYLLVPTLFGVVGKVINFIPVIGWLVGWIFTLVGTILGIYCIVGIVFAILNYKKQ